MQEELWKRIRNWLCEKAGHPFRGVKWEYDGQKHFDCKVCGKIISKDIDHEHSPDSSQHP